VRSKRTIYLWEISYTNSYGCYKANTKRLVFRESHSGSRERTGFNPPLTSGLLRAQQGMSNAPESVPHLCYWAEQSGWVTGFVNPGTTRQSKCQPNPWTKIQDYPKRGENWIKIFTSFSWSQIYPYPIVFCSGTQNLRISFGQIFIDLLHPRKQKNTINLIVSLWVFPLYI